MRKTFNFRLVAFAALTLILADSVASRQTVYGNLAQVEKNILAQRHVPFVKQLEQAYGVEADLVLGMMKTESAFDSRAVSGAGALGLMQLMPLTAQGEYERVSNVAVDPDFFRRQLLDQPDLNILLAVRHLSELERVFSGVRSLKKRRSLILASYNAGFRYVKQVFGCSRLACVGESSNNMTWRTFQNRLSHLPRETRRYIHIVEANRKAVQTML